MKSFLHLFYARSKEFYRDKGALSWSLLFPTLIIIGCAIAFSDDTQTLLTIGHYPSEQKPAIEALDKSYSRWIAYDNIDIAKNRLRHHQLHALIDEREQQIWLNPDSAQGQLLQQLLQYNTGYQTRELSGRPIRYVDWVIPGVLGMNIMFGSLFGVGYVLVRYRKNGVLKRLQATPVTAFEFLAAQVASRLFLVIITNAIIFIGSYLLLDLVFIGNSLSLLLTAIIGAMAMISLALVIAARTDSEELAGGVLNITTWPMMFMSGIWFSLDDTPELMQQFADLLPLTHLVKAARDIMIHGAGLMDVAHHLLIMLLMTVVFLSLAAILFKWHR